jgi:hypothetical protein
VNFLLTKKGRALLIIGLILVLSSLYPMYLIIREVVIENSILSRYEVEQVINIKNRMAPPGKSYYDFGSPIVWEGNTIEVVVEDTGLIVKESLLYNEHHIMNITIKINGEKVSFPTEAWLKKTNITKYSDYLSWLNIVKITDTKRKQDEINIIQALTGRQMIGQDDDQYRQSLKWRILHLSKDGQVTEEIFTYPERGDHLLGARLVLYSQQSDWMGYKSNALAYLPNYIYPSIYPFLTSFIGIILSGVGLILFIMKKKRRARKDFKNL